MPNFPFTWSVLSKWLNHSAIRGTYIWILVVPVLAKALQHLDETARLTVFSYSFELSLSLPFSWIVFYFSALAFGLSLAIYSYWCPRIIREHQGYASFAAERMGIEQLDKYLHEADMNWEGVDRIKREMSEHFTNIHMVSNPKADDGELRMNFWVVFDFAQTNHAEARCICSISLMIGAALMLYVLAENLTFVVSFLFRT